MNNSEFKIRSTPISAFTKEELLAVYRNMLLVRRLDEKMLILLKQGKGHFHIGCSGHEAIQLAAAMTLKSKTDWAYPYYRDLAFSVGLGLTSRDILSSHLSKVTDPSGGRQMPSHYNSREHKIVSVSSAIGANFLPGLGTAQASQFLEKDEVIYISTGEGGTSQGVFFELLNWATRCRAPVVIVVQDNKYAISVPVAEQTSNNSISKTVRGFENLEIFEVDGTDLMNSHAAMKKAVGRARKGEGPSLVHAHVVRLLPHSSSDDQNKYRDAGDLENDRRHDPIEKLKQRLLSSDMGTEKELDDLKQEVFEQVEADTAWCAKQDDPKAEEALLHVLSENPPEHEYEKGTPSGEPVVMVDAINHAMKEEMERDDNVLVFGQDVAGGKGGVFTATRGLTEKFGERRCYNSPLSEASILGTACGLAVRGLKPVAEIQFGDYIWPGMEMIKNQIDSLRYRSNNHFSCPMVIRVPIGGYIHGGLCHSQNIEATFAHFPGFRVVMPSNASDAKGMLKTAIRGDDPVIFLEHKALYRQGFARRPEPDSNYLVPLDKAAVVRKGSDVTVVTYGAMVQKALLAARKFSEAGTELEVIDIRSMLPLDMDTILASVSRTNRVLVLHEDYEYLGMGAEIAAQIADKVFTALDAPVKRVAAKFSPIPYAAQLEDYVLPNDNDIQTALEELIHY
ncbi:alpha-ketoacid dehydrogenase subunit alpha/beta [Natronogracilivirga saccharolytica]|uniref:Dehydrogenase E1 component subunit alpha/beta n=1 Tax=Natronogracilivirga saccharolytica TaxID=2812953 RepID=A0A8J7RFR4_9BACT|nr:dehydrogenase E1 component subunit alpha/beta [Natronogracilivirga saccharolytica]MBP3191095.1 dehydrogenase E1 component subunit alpha/beta [Natronogracilivirga saccharolytica]